MVVALKTAKRTLGKLVQDTSRTHRPVVIKGEAESAVLMSQADWKAIQETLYLLSVPGMRRSIRAGLKTPVSKCQKAIKW